MRPSMALVLALSAIYGCGRVDRPAAQPAPPRSAAVSPARAPEPAFCLVEMAKHDGPAHSVWLAWQDGEGRWSYERMFDLKPGPDARSAVARAVPLATHWLMLCDPGGFETDDFVHIGRVTGTAASPMPVVFAARNGKIRLLDEAE